MAEVEYSEDDRDEWALLLALAVQRAMRDVRERANLVLLTLGPGVPPLGWFDPAWWDEASAIHIAPVLRQVASEAAERFEQQSGFPFTAGEVAAAVAGTVAALEVLSSGRGRVAADRAVELTTRAAFEGRDAAWLGERLGVSDGGLPGPLSDAEGKAIGDGLSTGAAQMTADKLMVSAVGSDDRRGKPSGVVKTWVTVGDDRVRPSHRAVGGQTIPFGETWTLVSDGVVSEARYPFDPRLPVAEVAGCRCHARYRFRAASQPDSLPQVASPVMDTFAPNPDYSTGIMVCVRPTPEQADRLHSFTPDGLPPGELHVTLGYFGRTDDYDPARGDEIRSALEAAVRTAAGTTGPLEGDVTGVATLGDQDERAQVALIDAVGLGTLRAALVANLGPAGDVLSRSHDFLPHMTLAYRETPLPDDLEGEPVTFDALRLKWGANPETVVPLSGGQSGVFSAEPSVEVAAVEPDMPVDLSDIPDDALEAELARRVGERAIDDAREDGADVDPAQEVEAGVAAEAAVGEAIEEVREEITDTLRDMDGDPPKEPEVESEVEVEMAAETFVVIGDTDLPFTDEREHPWDGAEAHKRVAEWAAGESGKVDPDRMGRAFLWRDPDMDPGDRSAYGWGFADIVDGDLKAVPRGVFAAAAAIQGARGGGKDLPEEDRERIRSKLGALYERMAEKFDDDSIVAPWDAAAPQTVATLAAEDAVIVEIEPPSEPVDEWQAVGIVEDKPTDDGRMFAADSLEWRDLPLPFMFQDWNAPEHQGAEYAGQINRIWRDGNAVMMAGTFENNPAGMRCRELMGTKDRPSGFRGVSVDVADCAVVYTTPDGDEMDPMAAQDAWMAGEEVQRVFVRGKLMGLTALPFGAHPDAQAWRITEADDTEMAVAASAGHGARVRATLEGPVLVPASVPTAVVAAAAHAGPDRDAPPLSWFTLRPMPEPEPFTTFPDGRCYGLVAEWGDQHLGAHGVGVPTSRDFSRFTDGPDGGSQPWSRFYADGKYVLTRESKMVKVGPVILDNVHPDLRMAASDAQAFYAHTGAAVADVCLFANEHGIVAAGALRPDCSEVDARRLRASAISPDWRWIAGEHRVIALLAVNVSAFQVEGIAASAGRFRAWTGSGSDGAPLAVVAAGAFQPEPRRRQQARIDALECQVRELSGIVSEVSGWVSDERAARARAVLGI